MPFTGLAHPRVAPPSVIDPIHHPTVVAFHAPTAAQVDTLTGAVAAHAPGPIIDPVVFHPTPSPAPAPTSSGGAPPFGATGFGGGGSSASASAPATSSDDEEPEPVAASASAPLRVTEATLPPAWKREAAIALGGVVVVGGVATAAVLYMRGRKKGRR